MPESCNCTKQACDCTPQSCNKAVIMEYDPDKGSGVKIGAIKSCYAGAISSAATHQTKVKVTVTVKEGIVTAVKDFVEAHKNAAEDQKKEKESMKSLVESIDESKRRFDLIGITVPAQ